MKAYRGLPLTYNRVRTAQKPVLFLVVLLSIFVYLIPSNVVAADTASFITVWNTQTANNEVITFPGVGDYRINWGDGVTDDASGTATHSYNTAGDHTITVSDTIDRFNLNLGTSKANLLDVKQWGTARWKSMENAFHGALKMRMSATDKPNLSMVTSMSNMFRGNNLFNGNIGGWNVATVTDMNNMFNSASVFDQDIGRWNVAAVTNMNFMFFSASAFDQDIGRWNVATVTNMNGMFFVATTFNQYIGEWNVAAVTDMGYMFSSAYAFNQDIGGWNVGAVTKMNSMFDSATAFNQYIGRWNVAAVTDMSFMFNSARVFNQDISTWNVVAVTNMNNMFKNATAFNQNLGRWYIVPSDPGNDDGGTNLEVLTLSAQNTILSGHNPVYTLVDGDRADALFTLTTDVTNGTTLSVINTAAIRSGVYSVRIAASDTTFGSNNAVVIIITATNVTGTDADAVTIASAVSSFTLDVDGSTIFDINDALMIARYALSIIGANLTASLTKVFHESVVRNIEAGESSLYLDVDGSGGFDINDALMIVRYALSIKGANLTASLTDKNPTFVVENIERFLP